MAESDQIFPGGAYQGGDDSITTMGSVIVSPFGIQFESDSFNVSFPSEALQLDLDETGDRILMRHPNYPGWTVYCLDPEILNHRSLERFGLRKKLEELKYEKFGPSKHAVRVYMTLGAIVLIMLGLWGLTDPIVGLIVQTLPAEWETKVGNSAFEEIETEFDLTDEAILTNRVHLVTQRLKRGLPYGSPKFEFHVADHFMVNAYALPGGKVIVMRGLLEEADAEELAGVLAHEMAHVLQKHGMRQLAQVAGPQFIAKYIFGRDSALSAMVSGAAILGHFTHSRSHERSADKEAFDILVRANIDPRAQTKFFKKIRKAEGKDSEVEDVFSTHPATAERIKYLEKLWEECPKKSGYQPISAGEQPKRSEKGFRFF